MRRKMKMDFYSTEESVSRALAMKGKPVIIADGADSTNSGAPGDSVHLLWELMQRVIPGGALTIMVDPEAVAHARAIGTEGVFSFSVGGKRDTIFSKPLKVSGTVLFVKPARYTLTGHGAQNLDMDMGMSAAVQINDVTLLLVEAAGAGSTPFMYRCVGLEPKDYKIVIVKSPAGFRREFGPFAAGIIVADTPGCASPRFENMSFTRVSRPVWPLDEIDSWRNVDWIKEML